MDHWIERAQTGEATLATVRQGAEHAKEELRLIKDTFGIRGNSMEYRIDFDALVKSLGPDQCAELKSIIDAQ